MPYEFDCGYIWKPERNSYYMTPFHYNFQNGAYFINCPHCGNKHIYHYTLHSKGVIDTPRIEGGINLSIKQMEKIIQDTQKKRESKPQQNVMDFSEIPQRIEAKVNSYQWKKDDRGRNCLYITLETKTGQLIKNQKYSVMFMERLSEAMTSLGFKEVKDIKDYITWNLESFSQPGITANPRLIPVSPVAEPREED